RPAAGAGRFDGDHVAVGDRHVHQRRLPAQVGAEQPGAGDPAHRRSGLVHSGDRSPPRSLIRPVASPRAAACRSRIRAPADLRPAIVPPPYRRRSSHHTRVASSATITTITATQIQETPPPGAGPRAFIVFVPSLRCQVTVDPDSSPSCSVTPSGNVMDRSACHGATSVAVSAESSASSSAWASPLKSPWTTYWPPSWVICSMPLVASLIWTSGVRVRVSVTPT